MTRDVQRVTRDVQRVTRDGVRHTARYPTPHKNGREDRSSRPFYVYRKQFCGLDVKAEVHDVAVLDHVLLTLDA